MSRSGGQGRASQMSFQEELIAKKKAEIEAKLSQRASSSLPGGSRAHQESSAAMTDHGLGEGPSSTPSVKQVSPSGRNPIKNRWGLKGKKTSEEGKPVEVPKLLFSNDGSFLEKFKQLQKQEQTPEPNPVGQIPQSDLQTCIKTESTVQTSSGPGTEKPSERKQEQEWYLKALERARNIAKSIKKESGTSDGSDGAGSALVPEGEASGGSMPDTKVVKNEAEDDRLLASDIELPTVADELASLVAVNGDQVEVMARDRNVDEQELQFLRERDGEIYTRYRRKVELLRRGFKDEAKRARKQTRWGCESDKVDLQASTTSAANPNLAGKSSELLAYAMKVFGTTDLEEHQWKQCNDQLKMSFVYNQMLAKQQQNERLAQQGKRKYEYDSDEDIEDGTWEHKVRRQEMEKTAAEAEKLTKAAAGKHHIGDFLPPEELSKFLAKYKAVRNGEEYEESDYQEHKLTESNMGFRMLQKMGWSEGSGLGSNAQGITKPVNQGTQSSDKKGLGVAKPHDLEKEDDEFDAYRKRMMLAYRFRPNPLNNPRRAYY